MSGHYRLFCLVDYDVDLWADPLCLPFDARWIIWQLEECPTTGREHIQAACYWDSPTTFEEAKNRIWFDRPINGKLFIARGNVEAQVVYCTKEESRLAGPWELGKRPKQGARNDLRAAVELVLNDNFEELDAEFGGTAVRYWKHIDQYASMLRNLRAGETRRQVKVIVLWGAAGAGKSSSLPVGRDVFWGATKRADGTFWWSGYRGQSTVILDDFKGCDLQYFLRLTDGHPFQVETKGGHEWARWTTVYITSNTNPVRWWPNLPPDEYAALWRRLSSVTEVRGNTRPSPPDDMYTLSSDPEDILEPID